MARSADQLIRDAARSLAAVRVGNPRFEAELLLAHALRRPRIFLFTHPEYAPAGAERSRFDELLGRRLSGEPLQYVLGTAQFRELTLKVEPGVLIPRSETELLVDIAWRALLRRRPDQGAAAPSSPDARRGGWSGPRPEARHDAPSTPRPWVIDVGVGSGAILLGLLYESAQALTPDPSPCWFRPLGIDVSPVALRLTAENARLNGLPRPHLACGDLLAPVDPERPVAAIVSNPPYIATGEMPELPPEIREHEPPVALHGGPDGLAVIRELLDQALGFVARGTLLCIEIGATQEEAVSRELTRCGLRGIAEIHPDLAGRPRVVCVDPGRGGR
ncbi:MAG: peptide chain release factor N(5)-glutamine methyltransferase [Candidatus Eisenbacteria bacterium]|uniref:Peptide chain release factor N(5)-glutamine methyltransferase n=1 Tax=Eiseniibacteriota bacterium TaxID=2212470 RepID=A0A938BR10_UNCEI|nr:peptide chain release factor N(5)-glutamine methyltransferase [Candidatus Eisenbacteria bacterium]